MREEWIRYYEYLEELRQSGETNMFGATPYLQDQFGLDRNEASLILKDWMDNYQEISTKLGWSR